MGLRRGEFACSTEDMWPYLGIHGDVWVYLMDQIDMARKKELEALSEKREKLRRGIGIVALAGMHEIEIEEIVQGWEEAVGVAGLVRSVMRSVTFAKWTLEKGELRRDSVALGFGLEVGGPNERCKVKYLKDPKEKIHRLTYNRSQGIKGLDTKSFDVVLESAQVWPISQEIRLFGYKPGLGKKG